MKQLQDTPWWICDKGLENYIAYSDTDSIYVDAERLMKFIYPNYDELPAKEQDNLLEKVALKYESLVTKYYDKLAKDVFNVESHRLEMKTEACIRAAYFRATRRYAQWITKKEGVDVDDLDIKGLEFMKANFPPFFGKMFKKLVEDSLKGMGEDEILQQIKDFQDEIYSKDFDILKLGNPTGVKTLNKYVEGKPQGGEFLTRIGKGCPAAVRASLRYNDLVRFWKLDKKHSLIAQGDKVKWMYLKKNPYKLDSIAYLDFDLPEKIHDFIKQYGDREKMFETILLNKLEGFFNDLEWNLKLNDNIDNFFNF